MFVSGGVYKGSTSRFVYFYVNFTRLTKGVNTSVPEIILNVSVSAFHEMATKTTELIAKFIFNDYNLVYNVTELEIK